MLNERVMGSMRISVDCLQKHWDQGLLANTYQLLYQMMGDLQRYGTLFALDSSPYKHFSIHIEHSNKWDLNSRQIGMIETVHACGKAAKGLLNMRKISGWKFGRKDERCAQAEQNCLYLLRDGVMRMMNEQ